MDAMGNEIARLATTNEIAATQVIKCKQEAAKLRAAAAKIPVHPKGAMSYPAMVKYQIELVNDAQEAKDLASSARDLLHSAKIDLVEETGKVVDLRYQLQEEQTALNKSRAKVRSLRARLAKCSERAQADHDLDQTLRCLLESRKRQSPAVDPNDSGSSDDNSSKRGCLDHDG
jgi:hypothetical protein